MGFTYRFIKNRLPGVSIFLILFCGVYFYRFFIRDNFVTALVLLIGSTVGMGIVIIVWKKFSLTFADEIIHWATEKTLFRKLVAGGSFSYYEYQDDVGKIRITEPILRFFHLMIAFLSVASTFAKILNLEPQNPVADFTSAIVWVVLITSIPILLTPIIPIIWTMEDLQLKSWNSKWKTTRRISRKYRSRFNSIIAISSLSVAYTLNRDPNIRLLENVGNFITLLINGFFVLTYPIAILTTFYYLYFRNKLTTSVKSKLSIPIAQTRLVYVNEKGEAISEEQAFQLLEGEEIDKERSEDFEKEKSKTGKEPPSSKSSAPPSAAVEEKNIVTKGADKVVDTGKSIVGGIGKVGKSISDNTVGRVKALFSSEEKEEKKSGGSATEGLWDKDLDEVESKSSKKKYKGGSATEGLWDSDNEKD